MNLTALITATVVAALMIVIEHLLRRVLHLDPAARYNYVIGVATVLGITGATYGAISGDWPLVLTTWLLYVPAFAASGILVFVLYGHAEHDQLQREKDELQAKVDALEASR